MFKKIAARIPNASLKQYSLGEEIANGVIHGLGVIFGIVSMTVLLTLAALFGGTNHIICYLIYGFSLILLYTFSTLYHVLPQLTAKKVFKVLDHISIYLLIAGTYTPFLVLNLKGRIGLVLLVIIWSCAFIGIILKLFFVGRYTLVSTLLYLTMGWLIIVASKHLNEALPPMGLTLILAGGIAYTAGTVFYLLKKMPFHHAIWHVFVLAGSVFHFTAIVYSANF